jgi:hypothetical protein
MGRTKELTKKQAAFRDAILSGFNPSEAYRKAFNAEGMSRRTISAKAGALLKQDKIRMAITVAVRGGQVPAVRPPVPESVQLSMANRLGELKCAATLDPLDCFDELNHFKSIREMPEHVRRAIAGFEVDPVSFIIKVKFIDKIAAIMNYSKLAGDIPREKGPPPAPDEPRFDTSQWTEQDWEDFKRLRQRSKPAKVVNDATA